MTGRSWRDELVAHSEMLLRMFRGWGIPSTECEDLLQTVFLESLKTSHSYDQRLGPLHTWLRGIAKNVLKERWRRLQREANAVVDSHTWQVAEEQFDKKFELLWALQVWLAANPKHREVIELCINDKTIEQIAKHFGCSTGKASNMLRKAKDKLNRDWTRLFGMPLYPPSKKEPRDD